MQQIYKIGKKSSEKHQLFDVKRLRKVNDAAHR